MSAGVAVATTDREAWLAARRSYLTASDAAAVLGHSPWRSRLDVWREKVEGVSTVVESERMRLGRLLEPAILARYAEDTTLRVAPNDQLHRAAAHPWLAATPDAFVYDATGKLAGLAQAKATSSVAAWHDGQPPLYYQVQAAVEMVVADAPWDDFPTLIAGSDYTCPRVERHVAAEEAIIDALAEFWHRFVLPSTPPPPTSDGDIKTYLSMVPARQRSIISLPPAAVSLWEQMRLADAQAKIYDGRAKEAKAALLGLQGDAEVGVLPGTGYAMRRKVVEVGEKVTKPYTYQTYSVAKYKEK